MTRSEMDVFLWGTILLCCVMSVFNLVKNAKKGWPGTILSAGFMVFALTTYLYKTGAPQPYVVGGCVVLFLLLAADFILRAGNPPKRNRP